MHSCSDLLTLTMKLLKCTSHVCGELKTKMWSLTHSFFGFQSSDSREVIRENQDLAESLKTSSLFVFIGITKDRVSAFRKELLRY
jgi:hypothetical protein